MVSYGVAHLDQPAFSTLRAFAAAARHESVRQAADELGVTPSAVSHQIRILEDWIGAALFVRGPRQVRLTPLGRTLSRRVNAGFDAIARAVARARAGTRDASLRVSALPLFTSVWLIPRLERFHGVCEKAGVEISIDIDTTSSLADFDGGGVDVAVRNVQRPAANLISRKLLDLNAVPLCAASVAQRLAGPDDLAAATLIHISARPEGWPRWLEAISAPAETCLSTPSRRHSTPQPRVAASSWGWIPWSGTRPRPPGSSFPSGRSASARAPTSWSIGPAIVRAVRSLSSPIGCLAKCGPTTAVYRSTRGTQGARRARRLRRVRLVKLP